MPKRESALQQAAVHPTVRRMLSERAHRIRGRARSLAREVGEERFADALRVEESIRPGRKAKGGFKRAQARVIAGYEGASTVEFGGRFLPKYRIMQRASRTE